MKVAVTSDTAGALHEIKGRYDLFIHCGNFCPIVPGDYDSIQAQVAWLHAQFRPWLNRIDAEYKVIVPGFHDLAVSYLEPNFEYHLDAIYLRDQSATIGGLVVYGTPWVPFHLRKHTPDKSCFVSRSPQAYEGSLDKIPSNVNLLITRIPPKGILDKHKRSSLGDSRLLNKVSGLEELKMHVFGFAEDSGGQHLARHGQLFANGCLGDASYIEIEMDIS